MTFEVFLLLLTGFIFMVIGFYFWYLRTQQYKDKVLKNEANKSDRDKEKKGFCWSYPKNTGISNI